MSKLSKEWRAVGQHNTMVGGDLGISSPRLLLFDNSSRSISIFQNLNGNVLTKKFVTFKWKLIPFNRDKFDKNKRIDGKKVTLFH